MVDPLVLSCKVRDSRGAFNAYRELKCKMSIEWLFPDEKTSVLIPLLAYAQSLSFTDDPDYNYLRHLMAKICLDLDQVPLNHFDWSIKVKDVFQKISNPKVLDSEEFENLEKEVEEC